MRDEMGTSDLENDEPGYRHEAATREILSAINNCRDDEAPVFDVVLRNAAQICEAPLTSLLLLDESGNRLVLRAMWGEPLKHFKIDEHGVSLDSATNPAQAVRESRTSHVADMADSDAYRSNDPVRRTVVDKDGVRSLLSVPLLKNGKAIGCIDLFRRELRPFSKRHIALVEGFAQQAVIAIDNVRRFHEIQAANAELSLRLDREAATREILEVIARSRGDEEPVFEVILRHACQLCEAQFSSLMMTNEERTHNRLRSRVGREDAAQIATEWALDSGHAHSEAVRLGAVVHEVDLKDSELYAAGDPTRVFLVDDIGCRSALAVPLLRNKTAIGAFVLHRLGEARAFSDSEILLMESFATQAVIAIENVQQFKALEALNAELGDRVEEQVGEIERMSKLKRFLPAAVADTVISQGSDKLLRSHRSLLGVLFCDIRGFTSFCETAEPEETIEVLQTYHEELGKLINQHGAGVDHRMGDGIMVLFNDPLPCEDPAGDAVRLAIAMRARMVELSKHWKRSGYRLGFGVGVSLGYATVGLVGYEGRSDYTASGTAINLASRLCDEAADGEILLSPKVQIAIEDEFQTEPRGEMNLKGIRAPLEIFRLVGSAGQ